MNERIRELYEQARLHAKSIDADIDPKGWMDEYHRKFAELIVQECVLISRTSTDGFSAGNRMQEHFGVQS